MHVSLTLLFISFFALCTIDASKKDQKPSANRFSVFIGTTEDSGRCVKSGGEKILESQPGGTEHQKTDKSKRITISVEKKSDDSASTNRYGIQKAAAHHILNYPQSAQELESTTEESSEGHEVGLNESTDLLAPDQISSGFVDDVLQNFAALDVNDGFETKVASPGWRIINFNVGENSGLGFYSSETFIGIARNTDNPQEKLKKLASTNLKSSLYKIFESFDEHDRANLDYACIVQKEEESFATWWGMLIIYLWDQQTKEIKLITFPHNHRNPKYVNLHMRKGDLVIFATSTLRKTELKWIKQLAIGGNLESKLAEQKTPLQKTPSKIIFAFFK